MLTEIGQFWTTHGRCWPMFGRVRPTSVELGRLSADAGQTLATFDQPWASLEKIDDIGQPFPGPDAVFLAWACFGHVDFGWPHVVGEFYRFEHIVRMRSIPRIFIIPRCLRVRGAPPNSNNSKNPQICQISHGMSKISKHKYICGVDLDFFGHSTFRACRAFVES